MGNKGRRAVLCLHASYSGLSPPSSGGFGGSVVHVWVVDNITRFANDERPFLNVVDLEAEY